MDEPDRANKPSNKRGNRLLRAVLRIVGTQLPTFPQHKLTTAQKQQCRSLIQPGDILLDSNNAYLIPQLGNKLFFDSNWIHAAIYVGDGVVIDSGRKPYVARLTLDSFLNTTGLAIYRPRYQTDADLSAMLDYAQHAVGLPFNVTFEKADPRSLYCGQLVSNALASMPNPILLKPVEMFGHSLIPPAAVERSSELTCVWTSSPRFLSNLAAHIPALAVSIVAGSYAHTCGFGTVPGAIAGVLALAVVASVSRRQDQYYHLAD